MCLTRTPAAVVDRCSIGLPCHSCQCHAGKVFPAKMSLRICFTNGSFCFIVSHNHQPLCCNAGHAGKVFPATMSLFEKYWQNPRAKRSSMLQMQPLIDARIASRKELGLPPLQEAMRAPMQVPAGILRHTVLVASSWTMVSTVLLCY